MMLLSLGFISAAQMYTWNMHCSSRIKIITKDSTVTERTRDDRFEIWSFSDSLIVVGTIKFDDPEEDIGLWMADFDSEVDAGNLKIIRTYKVLNKETFSIEWVSDISSMLSYDTPTLASDGSIYITTNMDIINNLIIILLSICLSCLNTPFHKI